MKFARFLFPPLVIFCALSFLFFIAGNSKGYTDSTQRYLLRCVSASGSAVFIYALLITVVYVLRRITRRANETEHFPLPALVCGGVMFLCAFAAVIIMAAVKGR